MSVEELLTKVSKHNSSICACVLSHGDQYHHTLTGNYEIIDPEELVELADNMLVLAESAPELGDQGDTAFVEYQNHSVFARRIDDNVLVVLTEPMNMSGFKKIHVGINLFMKPLKKALAESAAPAEPMVLRAEPVASRQLRATPPKAELHADPAAQVDAPAEADTSETKPEEKPKKKRFYRGVAY